MSAFLTALTSVAAQRAEGQDLARQEKQATAERQQGFDLQKAYLDIAQKAQARQDEELKLRQAQGRFIDLGLPIFTEGGKRYKQFWDVTKSGWNRVELPGPSGTGSLDALKSVMGQFTPDQQNLIKSRYESTLQSTGDEAKALEQSQVLVDKLAERKMTEDAANDRAKATQSAADARAAASREAASRRQRAGFTEREKLNSNVIKAQSDAIDADARVQRMINDMADANNAEQNPAKYPNGAGAADMDLLSQHIALTFGAIKGGVRSKAMIDEHRNAVSLLERVKRVYQSGLHGAQLSPEQRANFLRIGQEAQQAAHNKYQDLRQSIQGIPPDQDTDEFDLQPEQPEQP